MQNGTQPTTYFQSEEWKLSFGWHCQDIVWWELHKGNHTIAIVTTFHDGYGLVDYINSNYWKEMQ